MKIHEIQEHMGFVDITKWLDIQSCFLVVEFLSKEKAALNITMKMDLWT